MNAQHIHYGIFALLALVTLVGALRVVLSRSIMHAAFWLFPVFAGVAGFYLYLGAQFLAAVQVLIYIGAILVLIIFAVTLTRNSMDPEDAQNNRFFIPVSLAAVALILALAGAAVANRWPKAFTTKQFEGLVLMPNVHVTDVTAIGVVLLRQYLLPFEIASVLLLAAMIGAIVMARKERIPPAQSGQPSTPEPMDVDEDVAVNV
jgi:NADH:ubiquinone oxidoreductase subunit 6 (subunit J)